MNISVIGCGYVGLTTGVGLAAIGHAVQVVDIDQNKIASIQNGLPPFYEPGLPEILQSVISSGRFRATTDLEQAVAGSEVVFICVGTPSKPDGSIETAFLKQSASQVADCMKKIERYQVLAIRSTVVPGTTSGLVSPLMHKVLKDRSAEYGVAVNPEFLQEGSAIIDFLSTDRVVLGVTDQRSREALAEVYAPLGAPMVFTSPTEAEMIKYTSNALLATLISFSNEIARICEALPGVDADHVMSAIHLDRRFYSSNGRESPAGIVSYLKPGCGFGGSCLPKDMRALLARTRELGVPSPLLNSVLDINETQPFHLVDLTEQAVGGLLGRRVAVLGLAFKGGTADMRESPALAIVKELLRRGALVSAFDPLVPQESPEVTGLDIDIATDLQGSLIGAEAVIVTTNAREFAALNPDILRAGTKMPVIVDGRRVLNPASFTAGDTAYLGVGRSTTEVM